MDVDGRRDDPAVEDSPDDERAVRTHATCPGRVVFTEDGNTDGWIATDLVVEPSP